MSVMFSEKEKIWQYLQLCFLNVSKIKTNKQKNTSKTQQELCHTNRNGLILFFTGLFLNFPF